MRYSYHVDIYRGSDTCGTQIGGAYRSKRLALATLRKELAALDTTGWGQVWRYPAAPHYTHNDGTLVAERFRGAK